VGRLSGSNCLEEKNFSVAFGKNSVGTGVLSGKWWAFTGRARGAGESLGRRRRATGRPEKCIFFTHTTKKMGKNRSPEPVFELPAHFTEWSGREGGPVGRPLARLWPPFARAGLAALRAALRAAPFSKGNPSGGLFSVRAALILSEGGRPAATRAPPPATMGGPSAQRRPHSGRP
jgi:hypothetical protein